MSERSLSVTEAARNFSDLVNRTHYRGETTVLVRSGRPVARIMPADGSSCLGSDLAAKWREMAHLSPDEAEEFAADLKKARELIEPPESKWDS